MRAEPRKAPALPASSLGQRAGDARRCEVLEGDVGVEPLSCNFRNSARGSPSKKTPTRARRPRRPRSRRSGGDREPRRRNRVSPPASGPVPLARQGHWRALRGHVRPFRKAAALSPGAGLQPGERRPFAIWSERCRRQRRHPSGQRRPRRRRRLPAQVGRGQFVAVSWRREDPRLSDHPVGRWTALALGGEPPGRSVREPQVIGGLHSWRGGTFRQGRWGAVGVHGLPTASTNPSATRHGARRRDPTARAAGSRWGRGRAGGRKATRARQPANPTKSANGCRPARQHDRDSHGVK